VASLGERVLGGGSIEREEAMELFELESPRISMTSDRAWANRIREHYKGNKIHLCSIVNAAAGARRIAASVPNLHFYQTGSPNMVHRSGTCEQAAAGQTARWSPPSGW
jgi:biotin synthase